MLLVTAIIKQLISYFVGAVRMLLKVAESRVRLRSEEREGVAGGVDFYECGGYKWGG